MSERIHDDITYRVPTDHTKGDLLLNAAFDTLMYYEPLDVWWIRYFNADAEDASSALEMVVLNERNARALLDHTNIPYLTREAISRTEHKYLVRALGKWVTESMFDLDIDEQAIIDEEKKD